MKEYEIIAENEIKSVKINFTENIDSFEELTEQLQLFKKILVDIDEKLMNLGNDFVSKNSLSEKQIDEIQEINHKLITEFINGTGLPFIGTK
ncbi:hypothetical protein RZS08_07425 [Arthrospira platensis SPKY1]|nr:hypothetical protein [Arthrospira platensis SPKY1]